MSLPCRFHSAPSNSDEDNAATTTQFQAHQAQRRAHAQRECNDRGLGIRAGSAQRRVSHGVCPISCVSLLTSCLSLHTSITFKFSAAPRVDVAQLLCFPLINDPVASQPKSRPCVQCWQGQHTACLPLSPSPKSFLKAGGGHIAHAHIDNALHAMDRMMRWRWGGSCVGAHGL